MKTVTFSDFLTIYSQELVPLSIEVESIKHAVYSDFYNDMGVLFDLYFMPEEKKMALGYDQIERQKILTLNKIRISHLLLIIDARKKNIKFFDRSVPKEWQQMIENGDFYIKRKELETAISQAEEALKKVYRKKPCFLEKWLRKVFHMEEIEDLSEEELIRCLREVNDKHREMEELLYQKLSLHELLQPRRSCFRGCLITIVCTTLVGVVMMYFNVSKRVEGVLTDLLSSESTFLLLKIFDSNSKEAQIK